MGVFHRERRAIFGDLNADHDGDNPFIGRVHGIETPTGLANARLIAAAPELLESLEEMVNQNDFALLAPAPDSISARQIARARTAIAKAKGLAPCL